MAERVETARQFLNTGRSGLGPRAGAHRVAESTPLFDGNVARSVDRVVGRRWALVLTFVALVAFLVSAVWVLVGSAFSVVGVVEQAGIVVCSLGFFSGNVAYQLATAAAHARRRQAPAVSPAELMDVFGDEVAPLVALVPSFKEDARVVRRTLFSAALQQYPCRRVVLLIDDPPDPADPSDRALLEAVRRLPGEVESVLAEGRGVVERIVGRARDELADRGEPDRVAARIAAGHERAAAWLERLADGWPVDDHEDAFFVDTVLRGLATSNRDYARELRSGDPVTLEATWLAVACDRLDAQFEVSVGSFERKPFANLSHEPNKAMNLNVYLSLLGEHVVAERRGEARLIRRARPGEAGTFVPDASFVLTLDADSVLHPEYSLRLLHYLRAPGNEHVAVAQTPYSAFPGATQRIERAAGATTDIQHLIHQGFTHFGATFWVGANAILRMPALRGIAVPVQADPPLARYIQDRTVIEDTESSIDLRAAGWQLYNYPERLAYSATPPDFGSLLIQRRRWANGGLIILPKLIRQLRASREAFRSRVGEGFLRFHYLTSTAWVNVALVVVFTLPYHPIVPMLWVAVGSLPYFGCYATDLRRSGYRITDLLTVYALNLLLLPVNLGGVVKSLHQAATGRKTPFARTPKVADRTLSPPLYALLALAIPAWLGTATTFDFTRHRPLHGVLDLANFLFFGYGLLRLIGITTIRQSLRISRKHPHRKPARHRRAHRSPAAAAAVRGRNHRASRPQDDFDTVTDAAGNDYASPAPTGPAASSSTRTATT